MFTQRTTSCDHRCGVYGAKVECPQCRAAGSCGILDMDFGECPPTFMCVVQGHILNDAQKGAEDGLRMPRHCRDGCRRIAPRPLMRRP
jgi:hypothetical protein